jgi:hypothetical protein
MENPVQLSIPITISYAALEAMLQQQLVGMYIPKQEEGTGHSPYAQLLDVGLTGSSAGNYNLLLRVQIKILRTVLKRDRVDLYASVALAFDNASQQLYVQHYSVESHTSSGLYNTALQVLVNKVSYNQIISKARIDISEIIKAELNKVNSQLEKGLELKGLKVKGAVAEVAVQNIAPKPDGLSLQVQAYGNLEVAIHDLASLLPSKTEEV